MTADFTPTVRALIRTRSQGRCEACGQRDAVQVHHRQYKSRGGQGNPANGLHVCGLGNAGGCHGRAHTKHGEQQGWSIRSGFDPLVIPLNHALYGVVFLRDDGTVSEQPPEE